MTKTDIVSNIAKDAGITKDKAEKAVGAFISSVEDSLSKGESVAIVGFGTFSVAKRAARKGRKPRTGEEIDIPEKIVPKFRPGKKLREAIKT